MSLRELFKTEGFWAEVRLEDFLDIALVAIALTIVLSWLKRRSTRPLLLAVAIGIIVYAAARSLNLYLTLQAFRVGLLVLLGATLVAYQEDLRRGFERLAAGQIFRRRKPPDACGQAILTMTEAAFDLAERRFGALMVIRGVEHLERHLRGGWAVDGKISVPLLLSIFDPHTPAHDGAVIIDERGRLDRLGVHLPLTSNLAALEGRGTRHAAALGLAESSDALVIVVSEERGTVSLAYGDQIEPVASHEELSAKLTGFFDARTPSPRPRRRGFWQRDLEIKFAATALAFALWLTIAAPSDPVQRSYDVSVELKNPPEDWILEGPFPNQVGVTLIGPEPAFRDLSPEDLRLTFDLQNLQLGDNKLSAESGQVQLPEPLRVARMDTENIYITARDSDASGE